MLLFKDMLRMAPPDMDVGRVAREQDVLCHRQFKSTFETVIGGDRLLKLRSVPSECHGCVSQDRTKKREDREVR